MKRKELYAQIVKLNLQNKVNEKYGVNGYLKLYIPHSDNAQRLAELRDIIANPTLLRSTFDTIFAEQQAADL